MYVVGFGGVLGAGALLMQVRVLLLLFAPTLPFGKGAFCVAAAACMALGAWTCLI